MAQDVVLAPGTACLQVTCVSPVLEPGMASAMRWQLMSHGGPICATPPCLGSAVPAGSGGLTRGWGCSLLPCVPGGLKSLGFMSHETVFMTPVPRAGLFRGSFLEMAQEDTPCRSSTTSPCPCCQGLELPPCPGHVERLRLLVPSWMWCHQELVAEVLLPLEVQAALSAWAGLAVLPQNPARLGDRGRGDFWAV